MKDALIVTALSVVPKNRVTRLMGRFGRARLPAALRRAFLRWYVGHYKVDLAEAEGRLDDFPDFVTFFTRPLKPGLRPVCPDADALVAPCDGVIASLGQVEDGWIPQAGGHRYRASDLLGGDTRYDDGSYAVIYLSPRDYHRVHTPREGAVVRFTYRPGALWPVFPAAVARVPDVFAGNERLTTWLSTDVGEIGLVMVGAFGVGRIRVVYDECVSNEGRPATDVTLPEPLALGRAAELGRFELGSTVILLLPRGTTAWTRAAGETVRLGERIARLTAST